MPWDIWEVTARRHLSNLLLLSQFLYSSSQYSSLGRGEKRLTICHAWLL